MQVKDKVRSKNPNGTTKKFVGTVCGIYDGCDYCNLMEHTYEINMSPWNEQFPGWQGKKVYVVFYDIPVKSCTLEEWVKQAMTKGESEKRAVKSYPRCPETHTMVFPEDDLELVEAYIEEEQHA